MRAPDRTSTCRRGPGPGAAQALDRLQQPPRAGPQLVELVEDRLRVGPLGDPADDVERTKAPDRRHRVEVGVERRRGQLHLRERLAGEHELGRQPHAVARRDCRRGPRAPGRARPPPSSARGAARRTAARSRSSAAGSGHGRGRCRRPRAASPRPARPRRRARTPAPAAAPARARRPELADHPEVQEPQPLAVERGRCRGGGRRGRRPRRGSAGSSRRASCAAASRRARVVRRRGLHGRALGLLHDQHPGGGELRRAPAAARVGGSDASDGAMRRDVRRLLREVELAPQRGVEVREHGLDVQQVGQALAAPGVAGEELQQREVGQDQPLGVGPLHLDHHARAVEQGRAVHLRDRAGGERDWSSNDPKRERQSVAELRDELRLHRPWAAAAARRRAGGRARPRRRRRRGPGASRASARACRTSGRAPPAPGAGRAPARPRGRRRAARGA